MEAKKGLLVVFMNAKPGREDAFNEWYDSHLDLICEPEGVVAAHRYRLSQTQLPGQDGGPNRYVTVYEMEDTEKGIANMLAHQREMNDDGDVSEMKAYVLDHLTSYRKPGF